MKIQIHGKPVFAHVEVDLAPGESIIAESDAMSSMSAKLDMSAKFNGGLFRAVIKRFFGGESLFVNHFTNNTGEPLHVYLTQPTPGDMQIQELNGDTFCIQKGAYIASTPTVKLGVQWAGIGSFFAGEGFFRLIVSGHGQVIFGAYGGIVEKEIKGEYIVDTGHLVAYEPHMKLKTQLAGGLFGSLFGGEGLVTRVEGTGKVYLQTRSLSGLATWVNGQIG